MQSISVCRADFEAWKHQCGMCSNYLELDEANNCYRHVHPTDSAVRCKAVQKLTPGEVRQRKNKKSNMMKKKKKMKKKNHLKALRAKNVVKLKKNVNGQFSMTRPQIEKSTKRISREASSIKASVVRSTAVECSDRGEWNPMSDFNVSDEDSE